MFVNTAHYLNAESYVTLANLATQAKFVGALNCSDNHEFMTIYINLHSSKCKQLGYSTDKPVYDKVPTDILPTAKNH